MKYKWGTKFKLSFAGSSHAKKIVGEIKYDFNNVTLDLNFLQKELKKRRPKGKFATKRIEKDEVIFKTGVKNNKCIGNLIKFEIPNSNLKPSDYSEIRTKLRPGHADMSAWLKYHDPNTFAGGGAFSGRMTALFVVAGCIADSILKKNGINLKFISNTMSIGASCGEYKARMFKNSFNAPVSLIKKFNNELNNATNTGDTLGGVIRTTVKNIPHGLGEPLFNSIESNLSRLLFAIPAVKGVEFGLGFKASTIPGSVNNDQIIIKNGNLATKTNNSGGILGGITNGMPLVFNTGFKPIPSIRKFQKTVDVASFKPVKIKINGRHDVCVIPRVIPVIESVVRIVLCDYL